MFNWYRSYSEIHILLLIIFNKFVKKVHKQ